MGGCSFLCSVPQSLSPQDRAVYKELSSSVRLFAAAAAAWPPPPTC